MPVTMKMDGDAAGGWMGEVHDGTLTTHSPEGETMFEAFMNMLHDHFGVSRHPGEPPPPPEAEDADAPEFHKMPAADLKDLMAQHGEEYVNKPQAVEFLQAKHDSDGVE